MCGEGEEVEERKLWCGFDFGIVVSGNFGEVGGKDFEKGVEMKREGVRGKGIEWIGEGYVWGVGVVEGG